MFVGTNSARRIDPCTAEAPETMPMLKTAHFISQKWPGQARPGQGREGAGGRTHQPGQANVPRDKISRSGEPLTPTIGGPLLGIIGSPLRWAIGKICNIQHMLIGVRGKLVPNRNSSTLA